MGDGVGVCRCQRALLLRACLCSRLCSFATATTPSGTSLPAAPPRWFRTTDLDPKLFPRAHTVHTRAALGGALACGTARRFLLAAYSPTRAEIPGCDVVHACVCLVARQQVSLLTRMHARTHTRTHAQTHTLTHTHTHTQRERERERRTRPDLESSKKENNE